MNEQIIILLFLIFSLGITLSLYILKAKKQINYKGDERWEMIQLKSYKIANISTWLLVIMILLLMFFDIVNIGLHFILKNVRPYAAPCSEA